MTRAEAIMQISALMMQCGMMMPLEWVKANGEGSPKMNAVRMAITALREQEQREWISVKEKFPNKNGFYLVYDKTCNMIGIRNFRVRDGYCQVTWRNDITHWMPLPEAPKED